MSNKYYQQVYEADRGKGYVAVDFLSLLSFAGLIVYAFLLLGMSKSGLFALFALSYIPIPVMAIYVSRLVLRSILAWRDKVSHEILD